MKTEAKPKFVPRELTPDEFKQANELSRQMRQKQLKLKQQKQQKALSQAEVNQLLSIVTAVSTMIQNSMSAGRSYRSQLWNACDKERKDEPGVQQAFKLLNSTNTAISKLKKQHSLLAGTIHKLKSQR